MLSISESDPDCVVNPVLADQLAEEISDEEYEAKAFGLLERSWTRDVASDDIARHSYRKAYAVLSEGNHYLLVMIDRALGRAEPPSPAPDRRAGR
jgi:hypothetical protein